jgi:hypothetical protein
MDVGETLSRDWQAIRHPGHHPNNPQEQRMSRITEARNAIDHASQQLAAMAANPLADAIADAGIGASFTAKDVQLALAMLGAIDKFGPGTNPAPLTPQTPTQATQVQPQQTQNI